MWRSWRSGGAQERRSAAWVRYRVLALGASRRVISLKPTPREDDRHTSRRRFRSASANEPPHGHPINRDKVYDEDFGGVVYVPSFGSIERNTSQGSSHLSQSGHVSGAQSLAETTTTRQSQCQHARKARRQRARGGRVEESRSLASGDSSDCDEVLKQKRRLMVSQHTM